jgi:hypothetical protein
MAVLDACSIPPSHSINYTFGDGKGKLNRIAGIGRSSPAECQRLADFAAIGQRATRGDSASTSPRLLRNRKNRYSHRLHRSGTIPILRKKISRNRRCDLRTLGSRHFGHVTITMASKLLGPRRARRSKYSSGSRRVSSARCCNPVNCPCEFRGYHYDAPHTMNAQSSRIICKDL